MSMMKLVNAGSKIISIQNDALYFRAPKIFVVPLSIGEEFDTFKFVYPPGSIQGYLSFGNKSSSLHLKNEDGSEETILKMRGFSFNAAMKDKLTFHFMTNFMFSDNQNVCVPQVRLMKKIKEMSASEKVLIYNLTNQFVINRVLKNDLSTLPFGYKKCE